MAMAPSSACLLQPYPFPIISSSTEKRTVPQALGLTLSVLHSHSHRPRSSPSLTPSYSYRAPRFRRGGRGASAKPSNFDEDGVIKDMEIYLNDLSLEYDSVWDTKPSWCQPWTIVLTGVTAITGSWLLFHMIAVTTIVALVIGVWWLVFLYLYPREYAQMISERRSRVKNGDEDTYGQEKL